MRADERFVKTLKGEETDRMPVIENSMWWYKTLYRWEEEGMPFKIKDYQGTMQEVAAIQEYFGLDVLVHWWIRPYTEASPQPKGFGCDRGVRDEESYEKLRATLFPELKMDKEFIDWVKKRKSKGDIVLEFIMNGPFWEPRDYMGIEEHLYAFYDQPGLYKRMVSEMMEWQKKVVEYAMNTLPFDYVTIAEDMSYNNGPLLSKEHFDEFMAPYYKEMVPFINSFGLPVLVDSDGDIKEPISWFNKVGVAGYHPLEAQAGCDVNEFAKRYPDTAFIGNFDKMIMHKGEAALRKEFERLKPCINRGKYIVSVDHQTPPSVSIEDYRLYVKLLKEYAKRGK